MGRAAGEIDAEPGLAVPSSDNLLRGLNPEQLAAVTLPARPSLILAGAAREMMTRLSAMLPVNVRGMWIGTFHGLCNRFLRAHWKLAGLPQGFQILDSADQLSAVKRVIKGGKADSKDELKVSRITTVCLGIVAVILGIAFE